jgi:hypothetical protein
MPPKKKSKLGEESKGSENLTWSDEEVELLLRVVRAYASQKDLMALNGKVSKTNTRTFVNNLSQFIRNLMGNMTSLSSPERK